MVPESTTPAGVVRFGAFQLDLRSGELIADGRRQILPLQPFSILTLLLEHPGEIVLRDQLRRQLWPSDTFVDFEHGLNAAVKRLRAALGDAADAPSYVETVPRRGYRLIAPVIGADPPASDASFVVVPAATAARAEDPRLVGRVTDGEDDTAPPQPRHSPLRTESSGRRRRAIAAGVALALVLAAGAALA